MRKAKYVSKVYTVAEINLVNRTRFFYNRKLMDVYLDPAHKDDFLSALSVSIGEFERMRLLAICPCFWARILFYVPSYVISRAWRRIGADSVVASVMGWAVTIAAATHVMNLET